MNSGTTTSRTFRTACATVLATALLVAVAPVASANGGPAAAAEPANAAEVVNVDGGGAYLDLASAGYTYEEAVEAFKDSDVVTVVRGDLPRENGEAPSRVARGVSLGWYVYVKLSKSQAKAVNAGSAATAAGLIGVITGGIGAAVAAGVYAYMVSLGNEGIDRCKNGVEMKFTYTGKSAGVKCY
ncbi:hypothetical protein [Streptomyces sp. NPDC089915]|uniref:hypothetical protein n=1 Tax=Streptomyces sp. NPDC089915 TaxID=3155186 RepID=UPI00344A5D2D